jgi:gliding motility-associated-like protein
LKKLYLLLFLLLGIVSRNLLSAQAPAIEWQKSYGGSYIDGFQWVGNEYSTTLIEVTSDGGYIVAGYTRSVDGDVSGTHTDSIGQYGDYWIVKLDVSGKIQWQKCLGGKFTDIPTSVKETPGGGYIVAGYSNSNDGDVSGNHGGNDYWIVKLTNKGAIEWQKSLGGTGEDIARSIQVTPHGGYIVAGYSGSLNGDVQGNRNGDYWIVKLNKSGNIEWQKCVGGSGVDHAFSLECTADNGYIVVGTSNSKDGDVTGNHGSEDYWVVKLNNNGSIAWQKSYGGSEEDYAHSIKCTTDGGYIIAGYSFSRNGDITNPRGGPYTYDYWVVKINGSGIIEWQRSLGGRAYDRCHDVALAQDGGYVFIGFSTSTDGDIKNSHGTFYWDYWVVKLNTSGTLEWEKSLGGSYEDFAHSIRSTPDGGYIVGGHTGSRDRDVTERKDPNESDFWIVKLKPEACIPSINIYTSSGTICSATPVTFTANATSTGTSPIYRWKVNGTNVGTNSNTFTSSTLNNNDFITCELVSNAACAATKNVTSNSIKITINSSPVVTITGDTCVGSELTANSDLSLSSLVWMLNGTTKVSEHTFGNKTGVTLAGGNGAGTNTNQLNKPARCNFDAAGNMYIADMINNRIQKWAPGATSGVTVAGGNGRGYYLNQFDKPTSVALDSKGNLYIADQTNNRIMKWVPGATTGAIFGSYVSTPTDVFIDANDNIYVSEQNNSSIKKFTAGSSIGVTVFGFTGYGSGQNQLSAPTGIFVDAAGSIYICDTDNNRVQKWTPGNMNAVTVAGGNGFGFGANQLANPLGVFVDDNGNIFVGDYNNNRVQKWAPGSASGITVAGGNGEGSAPGQLNHPISVQVNTNGELMVSDFGNHRVLKFSNTVPKTYTTLTPGNYTVIATTSNGCSTTSNWITVVASKTPQVSIAANTTAICPGVPVTFTASPLNGGTEPLYQWKVNGANTGTNNTSAFFSTINLKAGDVVSCELRSNASMCLTSKTSISNAITLSAAQPGVAAVKITASDTSICEGAPITFTATPTNGGTNTTYQWKVNGVNASTTANTATFSSASLKDGDVITCAITSSADLCPTALTATSNSITVQVTKAAVTSLSITANDTIICVGSTVNLNAVSVNGGANPVYKWSINGVSVGNNNATFSSSTFKNGDVVSCNLTSNMQCATPATIPSNTIKIVVDDKPVISMRRDTTIFAGSSIRLATTVTGNINSYLWTPAATLDNSTIVSPQARPTATTTYRLLVTTPGDCQASSLVTIATITEVKISNAFSPNNDGINDVWTIPGLSSYSNCSVQIFNRYGQLVFTSIGYQKPWNGTHNGQPLPVGTYYYIITTEQQGEKKSGSVTVLR